MACQVRSVDHLAETRFFHFWKEILSQR